jgi:hypothetical protein
VWVVQNSRSLKFLRIYPPLVTREWRVIDLGPFECPLVHGYELLEWEDLSNHEFLKAMWVIDFIILWGPLIIALVWPSVSSLVRRSGIIEVFKLSIPELWSP